MAKIFKDNKSINVDDNLVEMYVKDGWTCENSPRKPQNDDTDTKTEETTKSSSKVEKPIKKRFMR